MSEVRTSLLTAVAGWLLFLMILLSIASGLLAGVPNYFSGMAAWLAALLMFHRIGGIQRVQILLMIAVGLAGIVYAGSDGGLIPLLARAIGTNHALLAMLAAVSFLRLITEPHSGTGEQLPTGRAGFFRTLLGVHFFGAIINLSAVMIVGDRLSQRKPLSLFQGVTLSRGFSLAALWSPFFAAMGIALTHAPGANLIELVTHGFPVAMVGLLLAAVGLRSAQADGPFEGYPWQFGSLWLPGLLAIAIVIAHGLFPTVPILTLIALFSLGITLVTLTLRHGREGPRWITGYIPHTLPRVAGELTLFMAAGVLAVGLTALLAVHSYSLPLDHFGADEASLLLGGILLLSLCGIHPIITISATGSLLMPLVETPDLLGITFLMGWGLGVTASPLSAIHLAMQGRYGLPAIRLLLTNLPFVGPMLVVDILALHLYYA